MPFAVRKYLSVCSMARFYASTVKTRFTDRSYEFVENV